MFETEAPPSTLDKDIIEDEEIQLHMGSGEEIAVAYTPLGFIYLLQDGLRRVLALIR